MITTVLVVCRACSWHSQRRKRPDGGYGSCPSCGKRIVPRRKKNQYLREIDGRQQREAALTAALFERLHPERHLARMQKMHATFAAKRRERSTCRNGHPRTPENEYRYTKRTPSGGRREVITCLLCVQAQRQRTNALRAKNGKP